MLGGKTGWKRPLNFFFFFFGGGALFLGLESLGTCDTDAVSFTMFHGIFLFVKSSLYIFSLGIVIS